MATSPALLKLACTVVVLVAMLVVYAPPFTMADDLPTLCDIMKPMVKNMCGPYLKNETATPSANCCYLIATINNVIPDSDACECYKDTMWSLVWYHWWKAYPMAELCDVKTNYIISRTAICLAS
ncbi:hypothetical protein Ancab_031399 [Ancistrocladus abbreviatus]